METNQPANSQPTPANQLESLPSSLVTLALLPFVDPFELLTFRVVCQSAYAFVHGRRLTVGDGGGNADSDIAIGNDDDDANNDDDDANMSITSTNANSNANEQQDETTATSTEEEANILWRRALYLDFGFLSEEEEKRLEQHGAEDEFARISVLNRDLVEAKRKYRRLGMQTFRYRPSRTRDNSDASTARRSFLETDEVFTASTPFESWKHWMKLRNQFRKCAVHADATTGSISGLYGPYYLRSADVWQKIENWCDQQGSFGLRIRESLVPGRAVDVSSLIDEEDDDPDPMDFIYSAVQSIWCFYGGQKRPRTNDDCFAGLLGGYNAYDLCSCTRLVDVEEIMAQRRGMGQSFGNMLPFAYSRMVRPHKMIVIVRDLGRAFVAVAQGNLRVMPCDVIEWLDIYASRLEQGVYECDEIIPSRYAPFDTRSILLYPSIADSTGRTSRAVTRGIEVVASGVDAVERPGMFIYSIRIRLLQPGEDGYMTPSERGFTTCQLRSRHWIISQGDDGEPEHVRGDGVVGMYPLLKEGGYDLYEGQTAATAQEAGTDCEGKFSYQSATEASEDGTLEGSLLFVPGSLASPTGKEFDVQVAPFRLGEERIVF